MGIAVKRHPVWVQRQKLLHRLVDARLGLVRQPEQDVGIQALDPGGAQHVGRVARDVKALDPPDRLLDRIIEILHPDRRAIHPRPRQRVDARLVDLVRVDLDRELGTLRERRDLGHRARQIGDHLGRHQCGRAPAPVQARQPDALGQVLREKLQFRFQRLDVIRDRFRGLRALCPAGAEPAQPATERHMQIQRYVLGGVERLQPSPMYIGPDGLREMRRGRVARVPGYAGIEEPETGELRGICHESRLKSQWGGAALT